MKYLKGMMSARTDFVHGACIVKGHLRPYE